MYKRDTQQKQKGAVLFLSHDNPIAAQPRLKERQSVLSHGNPIPSRQPHHPLMVVLT